MKTVRVWGVIFGISALLLGASMVTAAESQPTSTEAKKYYLQTL